MRGTWNFYHISLCLFESIYNKKLKSKTVGQGLK